MGSVGEGEVGDCEGGGGGGECTWVCVGVYVW